jgi:pimeloyl-ACP methyl ester carboxylesterase
MASPDDIKDRPPGQQRPYPAPTKSGHIAFTPPGTDLECKTYYSIYGTLDNNSTRPPLVCIHGGPGATSIYMQPFSLLQVDYGVPVIIYDQLGCGQSTHLRDKKGDTEFWTIELFVAELRNLLDALHISDDTFDLLGHSWGAWIAVKFATQQQHVHAVNNDQKQEQEQEPKPTQQLRKLIIAQSTADMPLRTPYFEAQMRALPPPHGEAAAHALQTKQTSTPAYAAALTAWLHHHMCRLSPWPAEFTACMAALAEDDTVGSTLGLLMLKQDIRAEIGLLSAEVVLGGILIFNGKYDQAMDEVVRPFYELLPHGVGREWVCFGRSGHMAVLEETEEVVRVVGRFLGRE